MVPNARLIYIFQQHIISTNVMESINRTDVCQQKAMSLCLPADKLFVQPLSRSSAISVSVKILHMNDYLYVNGCVYI